MRNTMIFHKAILLALLFLLFSTDLFAQQLTLTEDDKQRIEQRIKEKADDFLSYLPEIAAKSDKSYEEKQTAREYIKLALKLFIGEGEKYKWIDANGYERLHDEVKMQTTSHGVANTPKPMKTYLSRLMALPYTKVEVDTVKAVRVNTIHQIGEDNYTATATFIQAFRSWRDGKLIINDVDPKQVTVYIRRIPISSYTGTKIYWQILLGDIRVTDWSQY